MGQHHHRLAPPVPVRQPLFQPGELPVADPHLVPQLGVVVLGVALGAKAQHRHPVERGFRVDRVAPGEVVEAAEQRVFGGAVGPGLLRESVRVPPLRHIELVVADGPRHFSRMRVLVQRRPHLGVLEVVAARGDVSRHAEPGATGVDGVDVVQGLAEIGQVALDIADDVEPDGHAERVPAGSGLRRDAECGGRGHRTTRGQHERPAIHQTPTFQLPRHRQRKGRMSELIIGVVAPAGACTRR